MSKLEEVQYFELSSTNRNILNTCSFEYSGLNRLLIASRNQLLSLGSEWGKFSLQELPLNGVPEDAEIASVTGFVTTTNNEDSPVIAVAFNCQNADSGRLATYSSTDATNDFSGTDFSFPVYAKTRPEKDDRVLSSENSGSYMHIYRKDKHATDETDVTDLGTITQSVSQAFQLDFTPLCLAHIDHDNILFVSGDDAKVNFFGESVFYEQQQQHEINSFEGSTASDSSKSDDEDDDGEAGSSSSSSSSSSKGGRRLPVPFPSQKSSNDGYEQLEGLDTFGFSDVVKSPVLSFTYSDKRKSPMAAVGCENGVLCVSSNDFGCKDLKFNGPLPCLGFVQDAVTPEVVVGGSLGFAAVVQAGNEFNVNILPESTNHDSVLCCKLADIDWDGKEEILVGTYGQQLLTYSRIEEGAALEHPSECRYALAWKRRFAYPIFSMDVGDFNQDGADELIVNTLRGVHILQPDLDRAADSIILSVSELKELASQEAKIHQQRQ
eukprot:CAMPEP_0203758466 /NCGR_PEP_ID=MMETSP0098-20131031/11307_1 /ASSEMBLY_ACC=CAM_ASM_000208 /TAXON_ID=96639 /ORGANISM=" , Strain NY0313808BC1" /LENGTH=492 /DNA_ID=CAMNT_0050650925 /DNA_START=43 /DNA_END=1521 /DNA_ORIENTATION=-